MRYHQNLFVFIILFCFLFSKAEAFENDSISKKWKVVFQLDNRLSKLAKTDVSVLGAKFGFQYKKKVRFGLSGSFILNPINVTYFNKKNNVEEENQIDFWYLGLFNDFVIYKDEKWDVFLTEQIGYGKPRYIREIDDNVISDAKIGLYFNEVSGQVNYKVLSWMGVGAGVGYRNLINKQSPLVRTFSAPVYIVKLILFPKAILNKLKKKLPPTNEENSENYNL